MLKILETSNLELNPSVVHPFVRIHVVDLYTGKYLEKQNINQVAAFHREEIIAYNRPKAKDPKQQKNKAGNRQQLEEEEQENLDNGGDEENNPEKGLQFKQSVCNIIPPFATNNTDLRITGNSRGIWNEQIHLNISAEYFFSPRTLLLFELLDFNATDVFKNPGNLDVNNYYRIAWGFLRPIGRAMHHFGISKLQLYRYKFIDRNSFNKPLDLQIPHVYYDFLWQRKQQYNSYLAIQLILSEAIQPYFVKWPPKTIYELEEQSDQYLQQRDMLGDEEETKLNEHQKRVIRRRRFKDEPCEIPDKLIFKFDTEHTGCLKLKFSHNGLWLVAACTMQIQEEQYEKIRQQITKTKQDFTQEKVEYKYYDKTWNTILHANLLHAKTVIKLFSLNKEADNEKPICIFEGHSNIIYDLDFSWNDSYLVSCSSDYTSKIWQIPPNANTIQEENQQCLLNLPHPSYLYTSKFFPSKSSSSSGEFLLLTCCYDGFLRVYSVNCLSLNSQQLKSIALDNFPITLSFESSSQGMAVTRAFCSSASGKLYTLSFNPNPFEISVSKTIQVSNVPISAVATLPVINGPLNGIILGMPLNNKLIITNPMIDNQRVQREFSSVNFEKSLGRIAVTPDGQYLCVAEDGQLGLFDIQMELRLEHKWEILFDPSIVLDVEWSEKYNIIAATGFCADRENKSRKNIPIFVYAYEKEDSWDKIADKYYQEIEEENKINIKMDYQQNIYQQQQQIPQYYDDGGLQQIQEQPKRKLQRL